MSHNDPHKDLAKAMREEARAETLANERIDALVDFDREVVQPAEDEELKQIYDHLLEDLMEVNQKIRDLRRGLNKAEAKRDFIEEQKHIAAKELQERYDNGN